MFSFCDKLFGLMVKDIEAMDASILRGETASGKKQKVPDHIAELVVNVVWDLSSKPMEGRVKRVTIHKPFSN